MSKESPTTKGIKGLVASISSNILAGLTSAVVILPIAIGAGLVAVAPLGPEYSAAGVLAGFYAGIFGTIAASLTGGSLLHISIPKTSLSVLIAALVAEFGIDPEIQSIIQNNNFKTTDFYIGIIGISVIVAGVLQILFGFFRLGILMTFIPYPVVAGFMNGVACLIVIGQLPVLLGAPRGADLSEIFNVVDGKILMSLAIGAVVIGTYFIVRRLSNRAPAALLGVCAGVLVFKLALPVQSIETLIPTIGQLPDTFPNPGRVFSLAVDLTPAQVYLLSVKVGATAIAIALIGSFQSLLSVSVADQLHGRRTNRNRELFAQGLGQVASGIFSGIAVGGSIQLVRLTKSAGANAKFVSLVAGLSLLILIWQFGWVLQDIPLAAVAAILLIGSIAIIDGWSRQLFVKLLKQRNQVTQTAVPVSLAITFFVAALVIFAGIMEAILAGTVISLFLFFQRSRELVLRRSMFGDLLHSRTVRRQEEAAYLRDNGKRIAIFELQGPIFFGTADQLAEHVEKVFGDIEIAVLDFRRVPDIDSSGALVLMRLDELFSKSDKVMLLSHLASDGPLREFLMEMGLDAPARDNRILDDLDAALRRAEDELLTRKGLEHSAQDEVALEEFDALKDLSRDEFAALKMQFSRCDYSEGERILAHSDESRFLLFLVRGSVSVQRRVPGANRTIRLATRRPGVLLGEMALLTDARRTADIYAETDVVAYKLEREAFENFCRENPVGAMHLVRNIGSLLSSRLEDLQVTIEHLES
ncbi:MAG: SulP family inorganic anion transporter [Alphaproteobacteria bacterium]|nr:SulP family inorganic anion transporter [Alphaproteobacteria bacterium]